MMMETMPFYICELAPTAETRTTSYVQARSVHRRDASTKPSPGNSLPQSSSKQPHKITMPSIKISLKQLFSFLSCRAGDDEDEAPPRALVVGGPTDFCHEETRGGGPLLAPIVGAPPPYVRKH
ncbi:hypothetical protein E4T50_03956 [Aureobasidium sp. EXF-12298]|nr:hypothetical protein E4T50_03956 [Aureobasidium sp. EXF-12298]